MKNKTKIFNFQLSIFNWKKMLLAVAVVLTAGTMAMAQTYPNTYVIKLQWVTNQFHATYNGVNVAGDFSLQGVIDQIRAHTATNTPGRAAIRFDDDVLGYMLASSNVLFSGSSSITNPWIEVTLSGKISSSAERTITVTYGASAIINNAATSIENTHDSGRTIFLEGTGAKVTISAGTVSATGANGVAILNAGGGANVTISGGIVKSANTHPTTGTISISTGGSMDILDSDSESGIINTAPATGYRNAIYNASNNPVQFNTWADYDFYGVIAGTGTGGIAILGGNLTLFGDNTYSGTTTLHNGAYLRIIGDFKSSGIVNHGGALYFNRTGGSYSGVISGAGGVMIQGAGSFTLSGNNTYQGTTVIFENRTLVLTGSIANSSGVRMYANSKFNVSSGNKTIKGLGTVSNSTAEVILGSSRLSIDNNNSNTFEGVISGFGGVTKTGGGKLTLTGNNTYSGVTNVNAGSLQIGAGGTTGRVTGNIALAANTGVIFNRSTADTYDGVISGEGWVNIAGGDMTFTGIHTYTGNTEITNSTLRLSGNGSIAQSSVGIEWGFFNISASSTDILSVKGIYSISSGSGGIVTLGGRTLAVDVASGRSLQWDGQLTGSGGFTKTGAGTLTMGNNSNAASGRLLLAQGTLVFGGPWLGNFEQAGGTLTVGNIHVGGTIRLGNGRVNMALNTSPPSRITAIGGFTSTGTTAININPATAPNNQVLISAASGLSASNFTLTNTGQASTLTATGQELRLTSAGTAPVITTQPVNVTTTAGQSTSFTIAASGTPTPAYQWQVSTNGGASWTNASGSIYTGGTTGTLTLSSGVTVSFNGYRYRCVVSNSAGTVTSNAVTLTVNAAGTAPVITTQPASSTITAGQNASFSVAASGTPAPTFQWQVSTNNGSSFSNVSNGGIYAGATAATLTLTNVPVANNGYLYRCVATNTSGSANSNAATLTVNAAFVPVTGITGVPVSATAGVPLTLSGTVTPANATNKTIVWSVFTAGSTGATITGGNILNTTAAGTVTVRATIVNGTAQGTNFTQDFQIVVSAAAPVSPVPIFDGLANTYSVGAPAVTLKVKGAGSETLTVFKVNGATTATFNPQTAGTYLIEASSPNGKLKIWRHVKVN